jgi:hypothetical protein
MPSSKVVFVVRFVVPSKSVLSALKWAFADLDDLSVSADKDTLTPEDLAKVKDLLKLRPIQFCLFLKTLVGREEMLKMMIEAIGVAKQ